MEQVDKNLDELIPNVSFDEFSIPSYEEWKEEVVGLLKGKPFEKSMFTKTYEGITLSPIYRMEDTESLTHPTTYPSMNSNLRGASASGYMKKPWEILQYSDGKTPKKANEMIRYELEKGTTSAAFYLDTATTLGVDMDKADNIIVADKGVSLSTISDIRDLLDGIDFEKFSLDVYAGASNSGLLAGIINILKEKNINLENLRGGILMDPIGEIVKRGKLYRSMDEYFDEMAHVIKWADDNVKHLKTVVIDTDVYHDGGGNDIQEVAYAMSTALTYLKAMERRGVDVDMFCRHLRFHFSVGANFFMEIAKLRSVKMLWAQIVEHCGGSSEAKKIELYVSTSTFCQTKYDPYVNILRAATQSFSAVVGGIDGMYVKPFDYCIRPSDEFSRRIARNIQIMEQHEFNFTQPIDPSGGSWYIEDLTEEFTQKAWEMFQEIEKIGGILIALKENIIQDQVDLVLNERFKNLATRKDRAVGNNMYPNMTEKLLEVPYTDFDTIFKERRCSINTHKQMRDKALVEMLLKELSSRDFTILGSMMDHIIKIMYHGGTLGEVNTALKDDNLKEHINNISPHRWTERYEELRMRTENYVKEYNDNVKIFLANMGPIPQHKARADFVTSFMQVAAFEVLTNNGFKSIDEAVEAAINSGADVTIICSTDITYPDLAPQITARIKDKKPEMKVFLAGAPTPELKESCDAAGMDDYISVRSNCYETLLKMQQEKGMI